MFDPKEAIGNVAAAAYRAVLKLPLSVRLLIRDALEAAVAAVSGVTLFLPASADDAKKLAITVSVAIGAAVIAVIRRKVWALVLDHLGDPGDSSDAPPQSGGV